MQHLFLSGVLAQSGAEATSHATETPAPPAEYLFTLFGLPVTNTIFSAWVVIILMVVFAYFTTRHMKQLPSGAQNALELIIELWIGVAEQAMGPRRARRFMPLVATLFLFILVSNWFGILPISYFMVTNAEGETVPLFRSPNSDLNVTAAMAIAIIALAEFFELRSLGLFGYLKGLLVPNPMRWLEIFTRPLSLAFRLFGNIFAGEVLLATMLAVAPYVLFVFIGLELFVGLIQALIFSMLSLVFLSIATVHEEGHGTYDDASTLEGEIAQTTHGQPI